jgi:hypothetical protein
MDYPLLMQVPLLVLQGGGKYIKFPVAKNDKCLILYCDRDISDWHSKGVEKQIPPTIRSHNSSDAIAICGVNYMEAGLGKDNFKRKNGEPAIQINGSDTGLVKYAELNAALQIAWTNIQTAFSGLGITIPNLDIEDAETPDIRTRSNL